MLSRTIEIFGCMTGFQIKSVTLVIVSLSWQSLLASSPSGYVVGWGVNHNLWSDPQSNTESVGESSGLVMIDGHVLSNAVAIDATGLVLMSGGTVAGVAGLSNVVSVSGNLALKSDGRIVALGGRRDEMKIPKELTNAVAIGGMGLVVTGSGKPFVLDDYSSTPYHQAFIPAALTNVISIGASDGMGIALRADNTVVQWSFNGQIEVERHPIEVTNGRVTTFLVRQADYIEINGLSNAVSIATGGGHSLALKRDGTVFGWGENRMGAATGVRETSSPIRWGPYSHDDSASEGLVRIDGNVLSNVVAIAAGNRFSLALKRDGTVVAWGQNTFHQTDVPIGLSNVVAIAAGPDYCLAITTNAAVAERFMQKSR